jgi:hypothetical protein
MFERTMVVDPSLLTPTFWDIVSEQGWNPTDEVTRIMYQRLGTNPYFDLRQLPERAPVLGLLVAGVDAGSAIEEIRIDPVPALLMMLLPPAAPLLALEAGPETNNP